MGVGWVGGCLVTRTHTCTLALLHRYKALVSLEESLQTALDEVRVVERDEKLSELEHLMSQAMAEVTKTEVAEDRIPDDTSIVVEDTKYTASTREHAPCMYSVVRG